MKITQVAFKSEDFYLQMCIVIFDWYEQTEVINEHCELSVCLLTFNRRDKEILMHQVIRRYSPALLIGHMCIISCMRHEKSIERNYTDKNYICFLKFCWI